MTLTFIQEIYEFINLFREIEKLTIKCVHLECASVFNQTCLINLICPKLCHTICLCEIYLTCRVTTYMFMCSLYISLIPCINRFTQCQVSKFDGQSVLNNVYLSFIWNWIPALNALPSKNRISRNGARIVW